MAKLTLNDVTSGYASTTAVNANNALVEVALENTLSRDGTGPNQMEADLDMNSNRILNLPAPTSSNEPARLIDVQESAVTGLPAQTGEAAKFLQTDGNVASWQVPDASEISFLQSGTGAVARTLQDKAREVVSVKDFGAVGDGTTDDTTAVQAFFTACKDKRGYIPAGKYKVTSAITIDPDHNYVIEGEGRDPNGTTASVIYNAGTGNCITINQTGAANNKQIRLSNLTISGTSASANGIHAVNVHNLNMEDVWITSHGGHGLYLNKCWTCSFKNVTSTQNGQHGIYAYQQNNQVVFDHCIVNSNSRSDGYANFYIGGSSTYENLGVTLLGCDISYAGSNPYTTVTTAYGLVIQHSHAVNVIGCYLELNSKTNNIYADNTVKNLTVMGCYIQDGVTTLGVTDGLRFINNTNTKVSVTTTVEIVGSLPGGISKQEIWGNTYNGGATTVYGAGAFEPTIARYTSAPTGGTWTTGDYVINTDPAGGDTERWVCSAGGTPGTWIPTGQIPSVYADHGDTAQTLTVFLSSPTNVWATPLTADRAVTLSTTNAFTGAKFRIVRAASATGAFNLNVGTGPLKALAVGTWCEVEYNGAAWVLTAYGAL